MRDPIEEIRERLSIEEVVGEVVTLKRAGASYKGLCPFHGEKSPSFIVTPSRGSYKCFGCGEGGDLFTFVQKTRHLDFAGALQFLARKAGVELPDPAQRPADSDARLYEVNAAAALYFQSMLATAQGAPARDYLERRRVTADTIDRFRLGYAPDTRDALCRRLRAEGYSAVELVGAGLALAAEEGGALRDRWHGRVIFPIRDAKGRIRGFGGRVMGDGQPKYLNSPAGALFDKSRVLYTIEHAVEQIRAAHEAVVVEGYMDALRAHQEGFPNVVATLGTAITEHQLRALARLAPRLVLALDADPAGQKAAVRAGLVALGAVAQEARTRARATALPGGARPETVQVYVATLPEGQDPDEAIATDPEVWRRAIAEAVPLMDHYFTLVEAGLDRARASWRQEAIDTLIPAIAHLDGVGYQQTYIERLSGLTGVDARYLREQAPGLAPSTTAPRRGRRSAPEATPAVSIDPVRRAEEYLIGLLLCYPSEALQEALAAHAPLTADLAPLYVALVQGGAPVEGDEELAERLRGAVAAEPPLRAPGSLQVARLALARLARERIKREMADHGAIAAEADSDTVHDLDGYTRQLLVHKEQLTARLLREQTEGRRQGH